MARYLLEQMKQRDEVRLKPYSRLRHPVSHQFLDHVSQLRYNLH